MIRVQNIRRQFDSLTVLGGVSLDIPRNRTTVLLGPSGCGKTTLLNILAGLDSGFRGKIAGKRKDERVSYCFQEDRLLDWLDVKGNIEFIFDDKIKHPERTDHYLKMMELQPYRNFKANKLSGGMRQRVAIARALAYPSGIVLMDEPFRSLDHTLKENVLRSLVRLFRKEPRTAVIVTHDLNDALVLADTVYVLSEKPARVLKRFQIKIPKEKRDCHSRGMIALKKELLEFL